MSSGRNDRETGLASRDSVRLHDDAGLEQLPSRSVAGIDDPFSGPAPYLTNLDDQNPDHQATIARAMNGQTLAASDVINLEMDLAAAICHPVETVDEETGEVGVWPRTVLVLADGTLVAFGSRGIVKSLQLLSRFCGRGPWLPPLKVILRQQTLGEKKRWLYLERVAPKREQVFREAK